MQREVKHGLDPIFTSINQDDVVVIRPQQWSGRPGDRVRIELHTFGVDGLGREGTIEWCTDSEQGRIPAPGGIVDVTLPAAPGMVRVEARWCGPDRCSHRRQCCRSRLRGAHADHPLVCVF